MLIHEIVDYCNTEYRNADTTKDFCHNCCHPSDCPGSCKDCLKQIHFPSSYPNGKKDYDCKNMINFYVCNYINKYTSEMLYLLRQSEKLKEIDEYHILSIGCGAAPDLMAFEQYVRETGSSKKISYLGFDINELWEPIHDRIKEYHCPEIIKTRFQYKDVIEFFDVGTVTKANVIVLQYVISHFYNTDQIHQIKSFFKNLIENVVKLKDNSQPFVIFINDANSCHRGRNYFEDLDSILTKQIKHKPAKCFYFEYNIINKAQRYGDKHLQNDILFDLDYIDLDIYKPWKECSSAQMLIKID